MIELSLILAIVTLSTFLWHSRKANNKLGRQLFEIMKETNEIKSALNLFKQRYHDHTNICDKCVKPKEDISIQLADTARCSVCGEVGECWDFELIKLYKSHNIPDQVIWQKLPRLLNTHVHKSERHSLVDINNKLSALVTKQRN